MKGLRPGPKPCRSTNLAEVCPELTTSSSGLCPRHEAERQASVDRRRDPDGRGREWAKRSAVFLSKHSLCARCLALGQLVAATAADHRMNRRALVAQGVQDPDADEHLVPLCASCHSEATAKFEGGFGRQVDIEAKLQWLRGGVADEGRSPGPLGPAA